MSESEEDEVPDGELVLELVLELVIIPAMTPEAAAAIEGAAGVVVVEVEFEEHTVALEGSVGTVLGICTLPGRLGERRASQREACADPRSKCIAGEVETAALRVL